MAALDDKALATRQAAMIGLSQLGFAAEPAVPKLVRLLEAPADRSQASSVLQAIGKPAVPALIRLLDHPSEEMRFEAIRLLGDIGGPARAAIPFLSKLTTDRSQTVRYRAVYSLGLICRSCEPVISLLRAALADESWDVRRTAANHLSQEPLVAQMTVDELLHEIERGNGAEKQRAIVNLGLIGLPAERAVPSLKRLAEGDNRKERELAREALQQIEAARQKEGHR
jgi:HEAT repeat protein